MRFAMITQLLITWNMVNMVRNNYYTLTLTKVNGNGTPWYPGGGPEDPDEEEDIDKLGAYLHFEIKVAPWVYWTTNFEI